VVALFGLVAALSVRPARNLLGRRQLMNASFDPLRLVNTYGAFGAITRVRREVVLEGADDPAPGPATVWKEYQFRAKPGDPARRPRQVAPYHLRLDWLAWFAGMSPARPPPLLPPPGAPPTPCPVTGWPGSRPCPRPPPTPGSSPWPPASSRATRPPAGSSAAPTRFPTARRRRSGPACTGTGSPPRPNAARPAPGGPGSCSGSTCRRCAGSTSGRPGGNGHPPGGVLAHENLQVSTGRSGRAETVPGPFGGRAPARGGDERLGGQAGLRRQHRGRLGVRPQPGPVARRPVADRPEGRRRGRAGGRLPRRRPHPPRRERVPARRLRHRGQRDRQPRLLAHQHRR